MLFENSKQFFCLVIASHLAFSFNICFARILLSVTFSRMSFIGTSQMNSPFLQRYLLIQICGKVLTQSGRDTQLRMHRKLLGKQFIFCIIFLFVHRCAFLKNKNNSQTFQHSQWTLCLILLFMHSILICIKADFMYIEGRNIINGLWKLMVDAISLHFILGKRYLDQQHVT